MTKKRETLLTLSGLRLGYQHGQRLTLLAPTINASIQTGAFICLLGPNGAGKSTLLRTLTGMQKAHGGSILLQGRLLQDYAGPELAKRISVVLTDRIAAGLLTSRQLVELGRQPYTGWSGKLSSSDHVIVDEALTAARASDLAARLVAELSDGERQKVMLARALAQQPSLLVLDEVTAFLDLPRRIELMAMLRDIAHQQERTVLLSTHDLDLALKTADTIWLMPKDGEFTSGLPEELVMSGALEKAFASEGLQFQPADGTFQVSGIPGRAVALEGEGPWLYWTGRALERAGLQVLKGIAASSSPTRVEVREASPPWTLRRDGLVSQEFGDLAGLLNEVQHNS